MDLREYIKYKLRAKHARLTRNKIPRVQESRTHARTQGYCVRRAKQCDVELCLPSVWLDIPQLHLHRKRLHFNAAHVILPMIDLSRLPVFDGPVFYMIYARFISSSRSARGGDEVEVRILRLGRDGRRVVTVDVHGAEVRFLEADEEARDKDGGESVR